MGSGNLDLKSEFHEAVCGLQRHACMQIGLGVEEQVQKWEVCGCSGPDGISKPTMRGR